MSMYTGNYLPDRDEAPWHISRRYKLRRQYVRLGLLLARQLRVAGRKDEEIACLEGVLKYDAANEPLYLLLVEGYLDQGNNSRAKEIYAQAEVNLQEVYGVGPGEGLVQLAGRLIGG